MALYAVVALLLRIVDDGVAGGPQRLAANVAVLGIVGLLGLAAAGATPPRRDVAVAVGVLVGVLATALAVAGPGPGGTGPAADLLGWSGVGAAGVLLEFAGAAQRRSLLRRAGLAFATLGAANVVRVVDAGRSPLSTALGVGAVAMLLVAAVPFLLVTVRAVRRQQDLAGRRLAAAEAAVAGMTERDHELRNLVAGLSGAASVLTDDHAAASPDGRRLLVAAGSELERLQRMLAAPRPNRPASITPGRTWVGCCAISPWCTGRTGCRSRWRSTVTRTPAWSPACWPRC